MDDIQSAGAQKWAGVGEELKACPFCGIHPHVMGRHRDGRPLMGIIHAYDCYMAMQPHSYYSAEALEDAWNRRAEMTEAIKPHQRTWAPSPTDPIPLNEVLQYARDMLLDDGSPDFRKMKVARALLACHVINEARETGAFTRYQEQG